MFTKKLLPVMIALALLLGAAAQPYAVQAAQAKPTLEIIEVERDREVTVRGEDFPRNTRFDVYLYPLGFDPEPEDRVDRFTTGSTGVFETSFDIPRKLEGYRRLVLFMESRDGNYDIETWFFNRNTGKSDRYTGTPSFTILDVVKDREVTLRLRNLPPDDRFEVLMDEIGTQAKDGIHVGWVSTGFGGNRQVTFSIPSALRGESRIAVRIESPTSGYYYYNWFYNRTDWYGGGDADKDKGGSGGKVALTVSVTEVVQDQRIEVLIGGLPQKSQFRVLMMAPGSNWKDAVEVLRTSSLNGKVVRAPLAVPASLRGQERLLVRVEHISSGATATFEVRNQ